MSEMTDREMIELATKAAGLEIEFMHEMHPIAFLDHDQDWPRSMFNPLNDDGDALRLAVRLGININFGNHDEGAVIAFDFTGRFSDCEESGDPNTATRRAIVRAAAEIGKQIP